MSRGHARQPIHHTLKTLTTRKLSQTNYQQWSTAIRIALTGIGYHRHLTDRCPDARSSGYEQWIMDDAYIVSLMWQSMESSVADMSTHIFTCREL